MSTQRPLFLCFAAACVFVVAIEPLRYQPINVDSAAQRDYQIIAFTARQVSSDDEHRGRQLTLLDHTSAEIPPGAFGMTQMAPKFKSINNDALKSLLQDLVSRNKHPLPIDNSRLQVIPAPGFVTETELRQTFGKGGGWWKGFYAAHPHSAGITYISRPGFAADPTGALVYVGTMSHELAGIGKLYLLEEHNGRWQLKEQTTVWMS